MIDLISVKALYYIRSHQTLCALSDFLGYLQLMPASLGPQIHLLNSFRYRLKRFIKPDIIVVSEPLHVDVLAPHHLRFQLTHDRTFG